MTSKVTFKSTAQEAKNGLLKEQHAALRKAGSAVLREVRNEAKKITRPSAQKANVTNIAVRTYTRTKYGFVVAHIGFLGAAKARGQKEEAENYEAEVQLGTRTTRGNPYLAQTVHANIPLIRDTIAENLPNAKNSSSFAEQDEIIQ